MKIFLIGLMGLSFATFGFAQDVVGTWTWVAAGCRDSSLSSSSHITKSKKNNPFQIKASVLTLRGDGSAAMTIEVEDQVQNETGTYTVKNNRVVVNDPKLSEDDNPVLLMDIVDGDLLLVEKHTVVCGGSNQTYVYVFSNVD